MVWVFNDNVDMERWYKAFLKAHPAVEERGTILPWELVGRFKRRDIIKGYILYSADRSDGKTSDHREGMDQSVNIATSLAGNSRRGRRRGKPGSGSRRCRIDQTDGCPGQNGILVLRDVSGQVLPNHAVYTGPRAFRMSRDLAIAQQALVLFGSAGTDGSGAQMVGTSLTDSWLEWGRTNSRQRNFPASMATFRLPQTGA